MRHLHLVIILLTLTGVSVLDAQDDGWRIYPTADRGHVKEYVPTFEKHFKVEDGVLKGVCGLGKEFYEKHKCSTFEGVGQVWATHEAWPTDLKDFEVTFDYKWFQEEPMKKFGDFPDMNVGFRLNGAGQGYFVQWGMLGQIRPQRVKGGILGLGTHRGLKGQWAKVRILVAGPIIKIKIWPEKSRGVDVPEPAEWNVEVFDNWAGTEQKDFHQGALAFGFNGRKLFDTCVYEYRNIKIHKLTEDEVAKVAFFEEGTAPKAYIKGSSTTNVKTGDVPAINAADWAKAAMGDAGSIEAAANGVVLRAKGTGAAFAWTDANGRQFTFRAKSTKGARPVLGIRVTDPNWPEQVSYLDGAWRKGIAAVLYENENHTANCARFEWKDDTEYEFTVQAAHWLKWQITEVGNPENRVVFSAKTYRHDRRTSKKFFGLGVVGQEGAVTVTHVNIVE